MLALCWHEPSAALAESGKDEAEQNKKRECRPEGSGGQRRQPGCSQRLTDETLRPRRLLCRRNRRRWRIGGPGIGHLCALSLSRDFLHSGSPHFIGDLK